MFDFGFSELLLIAVVALIVIGPERLPKVARTAGLLLGRLRRYVNDVKADISREMQLDELKKMQQELADRIAATESIVRHEVHEVESAIAQEVAAPGLEAENMAVPQEDFPKTDSKLRGVSSSNGLKPAPIFSGTASPEKASTELTKAVTPAMPPERT